MSRSLAALQSLLPRGRAWTRAIGQRLTDYAQAIAREYDRIEARAADLIREAVPSDADELIDDWVDVTDATGCSSGASTEAKRAAVIARLNPQAPTEAFVRQVIEAAGYEPEFEHWLPFQVGRSTVGEALSNDEWQHTIGITVVSISAEDDASLECTVERVLHIHVLPLWTYGTPGGLFLITEDGDFLTTEGGDFLITD